MNSAKVKLIVAVITIAMVGLVVIQLIWMKRNAEMIEMHFSHDVHHSLSNVAFQIEKYDAYNYVYQSSSGKIDELIGDFYNTDMLNSAESINFTETDGQMEMAIKTSDTTFTFATESNGGQVNKKLLKGEAKVPLLDSSVVANDKSGYSWEDFHAKFSRYSNILKNMTFEMMFSERSMESRIPQSLLDKLIKNEFGRNGIDIPFTYSLYETANDRMVYNTSAGKELSQQEADVDKMYQIALFKDDFHGNYGLLTVYFPKQQFNLLASVWHIFGSSVIFLLIIMICFVLTLQIIYQQKKISELKTEFINNMTHELKTPVSTISLAAQMLHKEKVLESRDRIENYSSIIKDENDRLSSHIEKVLQFAKIDKGEIKLDRSILNLHDVIKDIVNSQKLRLHAESIELTKRLDASDVKVFADKDHLSNIIFNLLDNAMKYRKEHAKIEIFTENVKNGIKLAVRDNGIGMTSESVKKIFDKFYRVPTGNVHDVKGFGLGLSYVKQMVELHEGTIEVESEINRGSTFTVFLPTA